MDNPTEEVKAGAAPKIDTKAHFEQELTNIIGFVIGNTISGLLGSFNRVPPAVVLNIAARVAGVVMASSVRGDLQGILALRRDLKKSFDAGVSSVNATRQIVTPPGVTQPETRQ